MVLSEKNLLEQILSNIKNSLLHKDFELTELREANQKLEKEIKNNKIEF